MHKYVKKKIQKNGISLKRPNVRPKHLIDCLKDPVHYEFLHRFAKGMITNIYSLMQVASCNIHDPFRLDISAYLKKSKETIWVGCDADKTLFLV